MSSEPIDPAVAEAWAFLSAASGRSSHGASSDNSRRLAWDPGAERGWSATSEISAGARSLLDVLGPAVMPGPRRVRVIGHLGQTLDGFIATVGGESRNLSAPENIVHLHRLRALFDAVLVGVQTANDDDPKLTTRLVRGPNPVRVILDASLRARPELELFHDGLAPTVLVCASDAPQRVYSASTRVLRLASPRSSLKFAEVVTALRAEGLERLFVEGGGVTVSRALEEGVLDRLHVAVAPLVLGAGRPGLRIAERGSLGAALRPPCAHYPMGSDVLFDFDLRAPPVPGAK